MTEATISHGKDRGPIFFWREFEELYGFMSQWYMCPFEHEGTTYLSAEMWMMVQKARLFGDEDIATQMLATPTPAEHQALGRKVKGFDKQRWNENKSRIVEEGNYHKFTSSEPQLQLKRKLLETGERELVEASPTDRIWGVGFGADDAEENRKDWGENLLGKAIAAVRERLRRE
ncbi:hypothetical protein LTR66_003907 [Elasticomyces elasticus]|nr:hypothetical protein LTR66_003907 [Elasticomyces elasticus]KAK5006950.1 hypothetical protein LTR28_005860 [Elasticomyces elasticus]